MAKAHPNRIRNNADVCDISSNPLLDELSGSELVVYLRLLGQSARISKRRMTVPNRDLHRDASTASRALAGLVARGLIRVHVPPGCKRTIEVL